MSDPFKPKPASGIPISVKTEGYNTVIAKLALT